MKIGLIGNGAIANFARQEIEKRGHTIVAVLLRPDKVSQNSTLNVGAVKDLPGGIDVMIDCAGHTALAAFGPDILARGIDLVTVSLGALADANILEALTAASQKGGSTLHLASGAIGALDCLQAARVGAIGSVTYRGRKPPQGWKGSPAEDRLDLDAMTSGAEVHFNGTARAAALAYPKNANVAAAVAFAGIGFDDTQVMLIADADVTQNIHEITATGDFGTLHFQITGNALPDNPRSSALAAMSVVSKIEQLSNPIRF
ncbi:MAG: aspartate dehydrogenase [Sulfitobacter sp.]